MPAGTHTEPRSEWLTVPNLLSLGRLVLTPVLVVLIVAGRRVESAVLLAAMGATDWLDGQIARRTGTVTTLGIVLDPVSDRILTMAVLVTVLATGLMPVWLGGIVLAREVIVSLAFLALAKAGFGRPDVKLIGKTATFVLLAAMPAIVYGGPLRLPGLIAFGAGAVLSWAAFAAYVPDILAFMKERNRT